jgi:hypothetical protein
VGFAPPYPSYGSSHVLTDGAPRWCRWRKEERTVTLDFGCDESRDFPDMRGSSVILVDVHVIGQ